MRSNKSEMQDEVSGWLSPLSYCSSFMSHLNCWFVGLPNILEFFLQFRFSYNLNILRKQKTNLNVFAVTFLSQLSCRQQGWFQIWLSTWKSLNRFALVFTFSLAVMMPTAGKQDLKKKKKGVSFSCRNSPDTQWPILTGDVVEVVAVQFILQRGDPHG